MKILLLLRHAKSSHEVPGVPDHDRPLNERGKRDAPRMGRLLKTEGTIPDLIVSSTAVRALKTAQAVAEASGYKGEIQASRKLYLADSAAFVRMLRAIPDKKRRVLVVGHNPSLEILLGAVTGKSEILPTAALAKIELPIKRWQEFGKTTRGKLRKVWRPREVK